jgi:SAM-dependent methyltransferase
MGEHRLRYKNVNRYILNRALRDFAGGIEAGAIVLDVGAGSGHYRNFFLGKRYVAVDMGLEQLSYEGLDVVGDVRALPFADSIADCVISVEVLEHVYEQQVFLSELRRILKSGGRVLLTVPLCLGEHMQPHDYFRYTRFGLEKILSTSGFRVVEIHSRGGYFIFLAYHLRRFPEYLVSSSGIPRSFKKTIIRLLNPVFGYLIPFLLRPLDALDRKADTTLGFICVLQKPTGSGID